MRIVVCWLVSGIWKSSISRGQSKVGEVIILVLSWRLIFGRFRGMVSFLSQEMWPLRFPLPIPSQFGSRCWIRRYVFIEVFSMNSSRGSRPANTSSPAVGHFDLTGDMGSRASLWSFLAFSRKYLEDSRSDHSLKQPFHQMWCRTPHGTHGCSVEQ